MSKRFIDSLSTVTYGIRDGRSISVEEFFDTEQLFPRKAEQNAIAATLDQLDTLITLHQREPQFADMGQIRVERALMTMSMSLFSSS